jgi:hypothetical protein
MNRLYISDFLRGFASATGISANNARQFWDAISRELSSTERDDIEARGYGAGHAEGRNIALKAPHAEKQVVFRRRI